jgi:tetratricopeptide (TPR) repeat protein
VLKIFLISIDFFSSKFQCDTVISVAGVIMSLTKYILILVCSFLMIQSLSAQDSDKLENLQVFPKDISKKELVTIMKTFTSGLGVRCNFCHVGEGTDEVPFIFSVDHKPEKKTARAMILMMKAINDQYLKNMPLEDEPRISVTCATCHHGQPRPESMENILRAELNSKGIDSAIQKYRELRTQFYGGDSYDFTAKPLNRVASELMDKSKLPESLALLKLNDEFHQQSAWSELLMGDAYLKSGLKEEALQHYRKSSELDPKDAFAKKKIEELTAPEKPQ